MSLSEKVKKTLFRILFKNKASSEDYIQYLRSIGMTIGDNCTIFTPRNVLIDTQYPWMVRIGNNVQITQNVSIIDHDYSWSVLKHINGAEGKGEILGASGEIVIGDNVFIGVGATILRGTYISDNVIIGANSLVNGKVESNSVYAGNPAKKIMSIEDFYKKRKDKQIEEAKLLAKNYFNTFHKKPDKEIFHEYFMLFEDEYSGLDLIYKEKLKLTGNEEESIVFLKAHKKAYSSYEAFLEDCNLNKR